MPDQPKHPHPATGTSQPANVPAHPGPDRAAEEKKKDEAAKEQHQKQVSSGQSGAKMSDASGVDRTGVVPEQPQGLPASGADSTRAAAAKGADEAAARQQMRQAGVAGEFHDEIIDLLPALGSPPANGLTLSEVIDLVVQGDRQAMNVLRRLYGAPKQT